MPHRVRTAIRAGAARLHPSRLRVTWRWLWGLVAAARRRRRDERLTVAVDVTPFWETLTGVGWYLCRLLEQLGTRRDLALRLYGPRLLDFGDDPPRVELPEGPALEWVRYPVPDDLSIPHGILRRLFRLLEPLLIAADRSRVLFAPNFLPPRRFRWARGALVVTVHDVGVRRVPWTLQDETRQRLEERLAATLRTARLVLTPSQAVRREIEEAFGLPASRIVAIHHGAGHLNQLATRAGLPAGTPDEYILYVGTLEPRKNLGLVLAAWQELRQGGSGVPPLVLCGRFGWKSDELRAAVAQAESEGWLRHFGYIAPEQLGALYRRALLVVMPSLYEGFGLPVVEAHAAGAPVLASDIPVLREVAGDAALFAAADEPRAWADELRRFLADRPLQEDLRRRAARNAGRFSWRRAAQQTAQAFQRAALEDRPDAPA